MLRFLHDESGATSIEYALIALLISLAILAGAGVIGTSVNNTLNYAGGQLTP